MGRIRTHFVKNISKILVEKHPDKFSGDVDQNKKALGEMKMFDEKFTRNKVAGYIVRVVKKGKRI